MGRVVGQLCHVGGLFLLCTAWGVSVAAEPSAIKGRVKTAAGLGVEQARISALDQESTVFSDSQGRFVLEGCELPCVLLINHARFGSESVTVTDAGEVSITLTAKQEVFDRIDVTAGRAAGDSFAPETVASTEIRVDEKAHAPTSLTELVEGVAGVAENGQPGLFQVYSIRGVSRHRVLTLISGMQITGERRAGVATSFIDPLLMGSVDVLRGPASTYYGSGALGGVVQVFPKAFDGLEVDLSWNDFGDENVQAVGWGQGGWSIGVARRDVADDEVSDGSVQNTHFTQLSASIRKTWSHGDHNWELLILPSRGDDIGKPNTDFPDSRITEYPEEEHLLVKLGVQSETWSAHAFVHPNSLVTETLRIGSRLNVVENEAFDLGANVQRQWDLDGRGQVLAGLDYFGRQGVNADEFERRFADDSNGADEPAFLNTLDSASQNEVSAYGSVRGSIGATTWQSGARLTWQEQQNGDAAGRDDSAWTGFVGVLRPLWSGVELTANVGSGLRFPSLSERFFTGTTGRGGTIGNPDLDPERSVNVDLGLRWFGDRSFLSAQIFHMEIDDYIERVEVEEDLLTFVNLTSGTIEGFELEGFHQFTDQWTLDWSGHLIDGESDAGDALADISPDRLQVGLRFELERWAGRVQWQHRAAKNDPGSGELAIGAADLLSASVSFEITPGLKLTARGRNLLDEEYFSSADDKASAARGRSIGLGVSWHPTAD